MKHLKPIDGLRAYLALWVLADHVMGYCGIEDDGSISGLAKLLREGPLAVDIFIIISGFVIFMLLDQRKESYRQFITRRFFRLYPVFIIVFGLAVPVSLLHLWNIHHEGAYFSSTETLFYQKMATGYWQNFWSNIFLHVTMLHGVLLDQQGGGFPRLAFLGCGWSISLEWQFYLIAPLAFWLAVKNSWSRFGLGLGVLLLFLLGQHFSGGDGCLPLNVTFFAMGVVSYFAYKHFTQSADHKISPDSAFCSAVLLAAFIFILGLRERALIPLCLWMVFFSLLLEPDRSISSRWLVPLFTNRVAQYLGKISYCIYLSHEPMLYVVKAALLTYLPGLSYHPHLSLLFIGTLAGTLAASVLLHRFIELPGMALGKRLAAKMKM